MQHYSAFFRTAEGICLSNLSATYESRQELFEAAIQELCQKPPDKVAYASALVAVGNILHTAQTNMDALSQKEVEECQEAVFRVINDIRPIQELKAKRNRLEKESKPKKIKEQKNKISSCMSLTSCFGNKQW